MKNRRTFLKTVAAAGVVSWGGLGRSTGTRREARRERRARRRRIVWNNDGSDLQSTAHGRGQWPVPLKSVEQFLGNLMQYVEGTQVDSVFYNGHTNEPDWEFPRRHTQVLGESPLRHVVEFAHRRGMEFFYSIRMNDTHAAYFPPNRGYWVPFRLKHPELLLGYTTAREFEEKFLSWVHRFLALEEERERRGGVPSNVLPSDSELRRRVIEEHPLRDVIERRGLASRDLWSWPAYNYALPPVQDRFLDVVAGACERYDLDGVELDWLRMPPFFKLGQERRNIPIMNDFVHQVRLRLDHYGERRGRPILLAVRVPDTVELALSVGLDPETWVREGWVDLLMAGSGLMPFSIPMAEWVELGRRHGVPVYGCLDRIHPLLRTGRPKFDVRNPDITHDDPANYDAVRAAAHRFWEHGVDGIYLYDWHTHHGPTDPGDYGSVPRVGDPAPLRRKNKLYQVDPDFPVRPGQGALADACLPGQVPRVFAVRSGPNRARFELEVVDEPEKTRAVLLTQWKDPFDLKRASWRLMGRGLAAPSTPEWGSEWLDLEGGFPPGVAGAGGSEHRWTVLEVPAEFLRKGPNTFELEVSPPSGGDSSEPAELLQLRLSLQHAKG